MPQIWTAVVYEPCSCTSLVPQMVLGILNLFELIIVMLYHIYFYFIIHKSRVSLLAEMVVRPAAKLSQAQYHLKIIEDQIVGHVSRPLYVHRSNRMFKLVR